MRIRFFFLLSLLLLGAGCWDKGEQPTIAEPSVQKELPKTVIVHDSIATIPSEKIRNSPEEQEAVVYMSWGASGSPGELVVDRVTYIPKIVNGKYIALDRTYLFSQLKDGMPSCFSYTPVIALEGTIRLGEKTIPPEEVQPGGLSGNYYDLTVISLKNIHVFVVPCAEGEESE